MEKIVSPAGGVLIYSGWLSSASNGFIINHNNKYISIVASPLSFEKVENLKFGEILTKGQVIATMRGGVSDVERSLKWSLFSIDDDKLLSEIEYFISNQKPGDYSFVQTLMNKVIDQKKSISRIFLKWVHCNLIFPRPINWITVKLSCLE